MSDSERIIESLWGTDPKADVYAILDCARDPRVHPWIHRRALDFTSLYRGPVAPVLDRNAPYLVHLYRTSKWTRELFDLSWGKSWGIYLRTTQPMEKLRLHFRRMLRVKNERGGKMLFRFYDPRVLRVFLPTCEPPELKFVIGNAGTFFVESEDAAAWLRFAFTGAELLSERLEVQPVTAE